MTNIRRFLKNKKGSFSILFVIISFTLMLVITGYVDIMFKMFSINEIQGVMDTAGVSALSTAVDDNHWRVEELQINETQVLNNFHRLVGETLKSGGDSKLVDYDITAVVLPPADARMKRLGIPAGQRDQYFLVSEAYARYESNSFWDTIAFANLDFFNFFEGKNDSIRYNGVLEDGNAEIVVRSVVRLVLR